MRQTNAAAATIRLKTFKALLQLHCPAGAPLRCAVCHTFSSSFLRSGSSCVLRLTSFITSFVPIYYAAFTGQARASAARRCNPAHKARLLDHMAAPAARCLFRSIMLKELELITGRKQRTARKRLQSIRKKLGKEKWEFITIREFCDHTGLLEEDVTNRMIN